MDDISKFNFIDNYNSEKPQIVQKELIADTETAISSLIKLSADEKYSFLLESVEGGDQRGRFSLLGCDPDVIWEVKDNTVNIKCFCLYVCLNGRQKLYVPCERCWREFWSHTTTNQFMPYFWVPYLIQGMHHTILLACPSGLCL